MPAYLFLRLISNKIKLPFLFLGIIPGFQGTIPGFQGAIPGFQGAISVFSLNAGNLNLAKVEFLFQFLLLLLL